MVKINESTKNVILFLGAAFCLFLVVIITMQLFGDEDEIVIDNDQENLDVKQESETQIESLLK